ncbi:MAG TPA: hypothetical protein VKZ97_11265 [Flavobacteriaceae bacterium]|nr:hypothetical protein [Flavobacteriaceae bacterium]
MRKVLFFLGLLLVSCNQFKVKKTTPEAILDQELKTFNWNEVDEYPVFETCNTSLSKPEKKACFEQTLTSFISQSLYKDEIVVSQDLQDTIHMHFLVSDKGQLQITKAEIDSLTRVEIPQIESLLHQSIDSLPKIHPAIKRGQQVTTAFQLPLIISVREP